ncbi:hypothetical protein ACTFIV_003152 [Dictyostelium citrinum]
MVICKGCSSSFSSFSFSFSSYVLDESYHPFRMQFQTFLLPATEKFLSPKSNLASYVGLGVGHAFPVWRSATLYPMIQNQVPRHHSHLFPQVLGTFQESIINTQKPGTTELFMSSWQPSTLKVYDSNYSRFF